MITGEGAVEYIVEHAEVVVAFVQETKINQVSKVLLFLISCQNKEARSDSFN